MGKILSEMAIYHGLLSLRSPVFVVKDIREKIEHEVALG